MRRPRHEIEAQIPPRQDQGGSGNGGSNSRPQIRRQLERICEAIGVEYDDLVYMHILPGEVQFKTYDRNEEGAYHRDEADQPAMKHGRVFVDTITFVGDERDI